MSFLKNLKERKRIITCMKCGQKLRVPIASSNTLRITCPKCRATFDLKFVNPLKTVFNWNKQLSFKANIFQMFNKINQLPKGTRLILIIFICTTVLLISNSIYHVFFKTIPSPSSIPIETMESKSFLK